MAPTKHYPQRIQTLLGDRLKNYKIEDKVKAVEVVKIWEEVLTTFFPEALGKTMALHLSNGILTIASLTRDLADKISVLQSRILYELNARLGKVLVYRIHCEY